MKKRASKETVMAFCKAVYPEMTELAMASNGEEDILKDATAELTRLREAVEAAISRMKKDGFCPLCAEEYSATWDSCDHHESCALLAYGAALKGEG